MPPEPAPPPDPAQTSGAETFRRLGPAGPLAIAATVLPILGTLTLYSAMLGTDLGPWLAGQGAWAAVAYAAAFALLAGLALLPTYAQSALGGFAFGVEVGIAAALAAFLGGALIGYEIARRASGERVVRVVEEHPRWRAVRDALIGPEGGHGFWKTLGLVALVRLPPNSPFAITNLVLSSVHVPRSSFLLGTLVGMTPRTTVAVVIGASLNRVAGRLTEDDLDSAMPAWLFWTGVAITIAVVIVIGIIANRALGRVTGAPAA